jgi:hypothetical protein
VLRIVLEIGSACAKTLRLAKYVDNSSTPLPHDGRREARANCKGPETLMGPAGPDSSHDPDFLS